MDEDEDDIEGCFGTAGVALIVDIGDARKADPPELDEAIDIEGIRLEGETLRLDVVCPGCANAEIDCCCGELVLRLPNTDCWPCTLPKADVG